jgi:hypothetical protein
MDAIGNFVARFARSREEELSLDDYTPKQVRLLCEWYLRVRKSA